MEAKTKRVLTAVKEYTIIAFGLLLYTLGWVFFLIPNGLVGGGVTGIAAIIYYITGFPVSYSFFLINGVLLAIALKILGKAFGLKTVFAIMGGAFAGAGIAITFTQGGSSGGTDIIALMINKYRNISPGRLILMMDIIIVASSLFIPTQESVGHRVAIVIYGYILISVTSYTVDLVISGARQSIQMFIFSRNHDAIAEKITSIGRGVTVINAMGWFTKQEGKVLMVIVRRTESNFVFKVIRESDKNAFISVGNVMGVYGQGFDTIKK